MTGQTKQYAIGSPEYIFDAVRRMVNETMSTMDYDIKELRKASKSCDIGIGKSLEKFSSGFVSEMVLANVTIESTKRHVFNTVGIVPLDETKNLLRMIDSRKQELRDITEVFESTCKCTK